MSGTRFGATWNAMRRTERRHDGMPKPAGASTWDSSRSAVAAAAAGDSYKSQKTVSKQINDQVSETMQRVSESNEVQFATSSKTSVSSSSSSEQIIEIENVNRGRSVNHKYFQVLARYRSRVALRGIRVVVEYDEDFLPGLEVARTEVFSLDELDNLFPEIRPEERDRAIAAVRAAIQDRLEETSAQTDSGDLSTPDNALTSGLEPIELSREEWFINTGAYFVDTEVSPSTAVEPYVREAREAEVKRQLGIAGRHDAEAEALRAGKTVLPLEVGRLDVSLGASDEDS